MAGEGARVTDADLCELVINHLIETTPLPPTLAEPGNSDQRKAHIDAVTEWSSLLYRRQRAAHDLLYALGFKPSFTAKTLDDLLSVLPADNEQDQG